MPSPVEGADLPKMQAVPKRYPHRSIALFLSVPLVVAALWLVRSATSQMVDGEVRHGVRSRALVLSADGDHATVRIALPTENVVADVTRHGDFVAGDTIAVVHDPVDPGRASELGAPIPSTALERSLVVAAPIVLVMLGCRAFMRRRLDDDAEQPPRHGAVRGGRVVEPQPAR